LGQHLSLFYYRRQGRPQDEVISRVWIGRKLNPIEADRVVRQGITAVLDLTCEFSEAPAFLATNYLNLPVLDLTAPTSEQLRKAATFIDEHSIRGEVYVHCKIGYSRSAAAVGAYLLKNWTARNAEEAVELIRRVRPSLVVRPEAFAALRGFQRGFSQETLKAEPRIGTTLKVG
jgi:hypothetical protein